MTIIKKIGKVGTQNIVLDDVFAFAEKYKSDPMVLSACLMIVAKSIYGYAAFICREFRESNI